MSASRWIGAGMLAAMLLLAAVGPELAATSSEQNLARVTEGPGRDFLLGTDHLGRSTAARLAEGARNSMLIAGAAVLISLSFGTLLAVSAVAVRGAAPALRWIADVVQALPGFLAVLLIAGILGPGPLPIVLALALVSWVEPFRVVLLGAEAAARGPAVEAARLAGLPTGAIVLRLIMPPVLRPLIAIGGMMFGHAILSIAALGFLGLGLRPPTAEWGSMIADAIPYLGEAPRLLLLPALAIVTTVTGIFLVLGDVRGAP